MVYRAIGIWENQEESIVVFSAFLENAGTWTFEITATATFPSGNTVNGTLINQFIDENGLQFKVALISIQRDADEKMINGAAIAAETILPVVTDLPAMDKALGGSGDLFISAASKLQLQVDSLSKKNKAACVAFMGVLRWREEYNFLSSVTGASRNSIGGALWMGQEA